MPKYFLAILALLTASWTGAVSETSKQDRASIDRTPEGENAPASNAQAPVSTPLRPRPVAPPITFQFDLIGLLRQGQYAVLEAETAKLQSWFETGHESEFAVRQAYRQLYELSPQDLMKVNSWLQAYPKSYAARLARGTYYKQVGFKIRGEAPTSETPPQNLDGMQRFHEIARIDLEASLPLTSKPYLSVFHLLDIYGDNPEMRRALMEAGTRMLPSNMLVRARYMRGLTPRWGGSHEAMWAFLAEARKSGATELGVTELEAIIHDDMGDGAIQAGDRKSATEHFRQALELGAKVGGDLPEQLVFSRYYRCTLPGLQTYCE